MSTFTHHWMLNKVTRLFIIVYVLNCTKLFFKDYIAKGYKNSRLVPPDLGIILMFDLLLLLHWPQGYMLSLCIYFVEALPPIIVFFYCDHSFLLFLFVFLTNPIFFILEKLQFYCIGFRGRGSNYFPIYRYKEAEKWGVSKSVSS